MRRERLYLEDILTAADAIAEFTQAQNLESLKEIAFCEAPWSNS
jgi:uncharacterized protein with HEPN domain